MVTAYIALGSNVGDKLAHMQEAVDRLGQILKITAASPVYETAPMYVVDQPAFYNAAISACTDLNPMQLLKLLKDTEALVGRQVRKRYGPREVDLDLISYGSLQYTYALGGQVVLELPHPRSGERRFVLQPLADLDPKTVLLGLGQIRALLDATTDQAEGITRRDDAILSI